jgi:hypothetical protein
MAAGSTYTPIATQTLGSNQTTVTFSSIPSTYTDLILVVIGNSTQTGTGSNGLRCYFNNDSSTNYSTTYISGDGASVTSGRLTSYTYMTFGSINATSASVPSTSITNINNYSNSSTYKTALTRSNPIDGTDAWVNLWRSTAAINRIDITRDGTNQIKAGTTLTIYGIAAA